MLHEGPQRARCVSVEHVVEEKLFSPGRCPRQCSMGSNPQPSDSSAVLVFDKSTSTLRSRREDEKTVAGQETDHERYVLCAVVGVSAVWNQTAPLSRTPHVKYVRPR